MSSAVGTLICQAAHGRLGKSSGSDNTVGLTARLAVVTGIPRL